MAGDYDKLRDQYEAQLQRAYQLVMRELVGGVSVNDVIAQLENGVLGLEGLFPVTPSSMGDVLETIRAAYLAAGKHEATRARVKFDIRNLVAERMLAEQSSNLVTRISEAQRDALRVILSSGMQAGAGPRDTALDIVGRIGKTGRRTGGIIGLTGQQTQYVVTARAELSSGNPAAMNNYLNRQRRDHRFDATVRRHVKSGEPLDKTTVDKIVGRYSDRLLQLRGETVARTETLTAVNGAMHQAWTQSLGEGKVNASNVVRTWEAVMDRRTRHLHRLLNGQKRSPHESFEDAQGNHMMYPGDVSLGALSDTTIDCRCRIYTHVDHFSEAGL